jgi:chloramphenicol 3-O phosphotransferase
MIVVLNGASSSGKTAIARALQERWGRPLLHLGTDAMLAMLPAALVGMKPSATEGFEFRNDADARGPIVRVRRGEVGRKLEESFASAVRALAEGGHDLVVDLVLYDPSSLPAYVRAFRGLCVYFVGVRCDLPVLEARELARGDRFQNLARSQHAIVHTFSEFYDLEIDSTASGPHALAASVVAYVRAHPAPRSFVRLAAELCDAPAR